jgi:hypothetical protein
VEHHRSLAATSSELGTANGHPNDWWPVYPLPLALPTYLLRGHSLTHSQVEVPTAPAGELGCEHTRRLEQWIPTMHIRLPEDATWIWLNYWHVLQLARCPPGSFVPSTRCDAPSVADYHAFNSTFPMASGPRLPGLPCYRSS